MVLKFMKNLISNLIQNNLFSLILFLWCFKANAVLLQAAIVAVVLAYDLYSAYKYLVQKKPADAPIDGIQVFFSFAVIFLVLIGVMMLMGII